MNFDNAWTQSELAQKISIQELEKKNGELIVQLHDAEVDVATLRLEVIKLEKGQLALTVKLQDCASEIGRLSVRLKYQE